MGDIRRPTTPSHSHNFISQRNALSIISNRNLLPATHYKNEIKRLTNKQVLNKSECFDNSPFNFLFGKHFFII